MVTLKKLSLNICVGESGDRLTRASKILEELTGQKPSVGHAQRTIRSFGIQRNEEISVFCSVRNILANDLLERALRIKEYRLPSKCFSEEGTFCFGIDEHIDLDGMKYDPNIGIFGMNFVVICGKSGTDNRVTKEEAIQWKCFLHLQRFLSTVTTRFDPCTGCEIPCTTHVTYPPEIVKEIDQSNMDNSVEKHRRHLCIGQTFSHTQWPKHIKNLHDGYIKELERILTEKQSDIGYSVKLTSAVVESKNDLKQTADWYLFPDQIKINNVTMKQIEPIIDKLFVKDQSVIEIKHKTKTIEQQLEENNNLPVFSEQITCERLQGLWVLVCCHNQRDQRCGVIGPILVDEIEKYIQKTDRVDNIHSLKISHIGGHRFAGNVIVYPSGTWYGRVLPCHIPLLIDAHVSSSSPNDLKEKLKPLLRGYLDTS
ncbi:unnamed protein product [Adineta steineri]|uniref:Large ribosomal subunit protein uL5 n=1 Tax=Adineta steineri TaxID=433720 RepID=A0A814KDT8_9BILA|nr:unnamed protein product [Adineta steineri]